MVIVERHYLRTYGGGFVENFYGLKRERILRVKGGDLPRTRILAPSQLRESLKLSESDIWKNIAVMVGIPYLKRKLDEAHEIYAPQAALLGPRFNRDILSPDATPRQRVLFYYKWFIRNIYPSINAAYSFSLLAFNLAYLFSNTAFSSPLLWLIQTRIRRLSAEDHHVIALANEKPQVAPTPPARPGQTGSFFSPRTFVTSILPRLLSSLKLLLPTSIFALKFLEWWHASDFARQLSRKAAEGLELPPPVVSGIPQKVHETEVAGTTKPTNSVSLGHPPGTMSAPTPTPLAPSLRAKIRPPISSESHLPILTVPIPTPETSDLCPICLGPIITPTATQTGYVFCYTCIFKWVDGSHERQSAWMEGAGGDEGWGEDSESHSDGDRASKVDTGPMNIDNTKGTKTREGEWESGKGRCAITGKRLLGGVEGLRRIIV